MQLYKISKDNPNINKYGSRTVDLSFEDKPERPVYVFKSNKDRKRYINYVKSIVRSSEEYRSYISFLKRKMNMGHDALMPKINPENGKKYSIELHHDPFTLEEIINIVLSRDEALGKPHNPYELAEEVVELHYDDKVGLINLAVTHHQLAERGKIFIPLQWIYQRYDLFYKEFEDYMDSTQKAKIEIKIQMSSKCGDKIIADCLTPEFTYVNIEGVDFPEVPEEWSKLLKENDPIALLDND